MEIAKGTTLVGFKIRLGIVLAIDSLSRSSPGGFGFGPGAILSTTYYKLYEISHGLVTAMSGNLNLAEGYLGQARSAWRRGVNDHNHAMTPREIAKYLYDGLKTVPQFDAATNYVNLLVAGFDENEAASLWVTNGAGFNEYDRTAIGSGGPRAGELLFAENGEYDFEMTREAASLFANRMIHHAAIVDDWTGGDAIKVFLVKGNSGVELLSTSTIENLNQEFIGDAMDVVDEDEEMAADV